MDKTRGEKKTRSSYSRDRGGRRRDRDRNDGGDTREVFQRREERDFTEPVPENTRDDSVSSPPTTDTPPTTLRPFQPIRPAPYIDVARLNWPSQHSWECKHKCRSERDHYARWKDAYDSHLWDLYSILVERLAEDHEDNYTQKPSKVNFHLFAEFTYLNSSGYISDFA